MMMYTEQEFNEVSKLGKKRLLTVAVPALIVFAAAIAVFVYGQFSRSENLWLLTVLLTLLSGGGFIFLNGIWVKPVRKYAQHIDFMLHGRKASTTGHFVSISEESTLQELLPFCLLTMNVGEKNDPEDERTFYYDAQKESPSCKAGDMITVESNDRRICSLTALNS